MNDFKPPIQVRAIQPFQPSVQQEDQSTQPRVITAPDGRQFVMMPLAQAQPAKSRLQTVLESPAVTVAAIVGGAAAGAMLLGGIDANSSVPAPTPSPIVIEKPVVVDRNCIAFCSRPNQ